MFRNSQSESIYVHGKSVSVAESTRNLGVGVRVVRGQTVEQMLSMGQDSLKVGFRWDVHSRSRVPDPRSQVQGPVLICLRVFYMFEIFKYAYEHIPCAAFEYAAISSRWPIHSMTSRTFH